MLEIRDSAIVRVSAVREEIRAGRFVGQTSTIAPGILQGNVAIVPKSYADDFKRFCDLNPKPCPLIAVAAPGDPYLRELGDIDIRTDVPSYHVFRGGERVAEVADIGDIWTEDLVTFIMGCSFSFEEALCQAGLTSRHVEMGCNVPMYVTNSQANPAGPFSSEIVVTMRPYTPERAIEVIKLTARFPRNHGAPIYFGNPDKLGIRDINKPDFGDSVEIKEGEIPVFWACGVTPQFAIARAKPPIAITHKPGCMLVTDRLSREFMI
jgi:uncharacterized protein YcsI (UPF0317 family)